VRQAGAGPKERIVVDSMTSSALSLKLFIFKAHASQLLFANDSRAYETSGRFSW
jgi:hypothetical protein